MDTTTIHLVIAVVGFIGTIAGVYAAVKSTSAVHEQRLKTIEDEIRGLREARHHVADAVTANQAALMRVQSDVIQALRDVLLALRAKGGDQ